MKLQCSITEPLSSLSVAVSHAFVQIDAKLRVPECPSIPNRGTWELSILMPDFLRQQNLCQLSVSFQKPIFCAAIKIEIGERGDL